MKRSYYVSALSADTEALPMMEVIEAASFEEATDTAHRLAKAQFAGAAYELTNVTLRPERRVTDAPHALNVNFGKVVGSCR